MNFNTTLPQMVNLNNSVQMLNNTVRMRNLNNTYTEHSPKKEYQKIIIKYHPDKFPEDKKTYAKTKTKELNKEKYIKILRRFKKEIIQERNTIEKINCQDKIFHQNKSKLISILQKFSYRIPATTNLSEIKREYQLFRNEYVDALANYYINFIKTSHIYTNLCTIQYSDSLKKIRNLMYKSIENILQQELYKFPYNSYFFNQNPIINQIKEKYILICLYGYREIETIKKEFNDDISLEFKKYQIRENIINNLKYDPTIADSQIIIDLENNILNEEYFYQIYSQLDTLTRIKCKFI